MEESLSLLGQLKKEFQCQEVDIRTYSPLALAYMGDCVYDIIIRTVLLERANRSANNLHKMAIAYVNAGAQAHMIEALLAAGSLTEEEESVYRRGRNAKSYTKAKNASSGDYSRATGLEALLGYLYLKDDMQRAIELVKTALKILKQEL